MAVTIDGNLGVTSPDFEPSSSTVPTNGLFLPTTNTLAWATNSTERLRLDASGNLGIGTTPSYRLDVAGKSNIRNAGAISDAGLQGRFTDTGANNSRLNIGVTNSVAAFITGGSSSNPPFVWYTNDGSTEQMRIDSSGNLLVGTTSASGNGERISVVGSSASFVGYFANTSTGSRRGITATYTGASPPNDTGNEFIYCNDTSALRMTVRSNGGIANYSANNTNLSDERVKTAITPAPSWLAKINAIEVVNFKYKDQTHDDPNLGVIAQQVLSVAPELVDEDGFGVTPEDGVPLMAIFETDLKYAMLKAIQELTARLEALENK